jgi:hypothetical protein
MKLAVFPLSGDGIFEGAKWVESERKKNVFFRGSLFIT